MSANLRRALNVPMRVLGTQAGETGVYHPEGMDAPGLRPPRLLRCRGYEESVDDRGYLDVSHDEIAGLRLTERGIWAGVVDRAEVNSLVGLRFTCVWRGLRFQIVRRLLDDGTLQARLVYIGRNALSAKAAGLQKTDAGAYEATAAWSELGEVQGIELTPVA